MRPNRRNTERIPYGHPVRFMVLGRNDQPPDRVWTEGEILDLGSGGIGMRIEGTAPVEGTVIQARIPVGDSTAVLPVVAQMRWMKEQSAGVYQVGLQFVF